MDGLSPLRVRPARGVGAAELRNGQPADKVMAPPDIPKEQALVASRALIRELVGSMTPTGCPSRTTSRWPPTPS